MERFKVIFSWVLVALMFFVFFNKSTKATNAVKDLKVMKFEVHKVDKETGFDAPIKAEKVSIKGIKGGSYKAKYLAGGLYQTERMPVGQYLVNLAVDGNSVNYLVTNQPKKPTAILKIYPGDKMISKDNINASDFVDYDNNNQFMKLIVSASYEKFMKPEGNKTEDSSLMVIPVGASLLAQGSGSEFRAVGYTNGDLSSFKTDDSFMEVINNATPVGELVLKQSLITGIYFKQTDDKEVLLVTARHFDEDNAIERLYIFNLKDNDMVLQRLNDNDYLEVANPAIYIGDKNVLVVSSFKESDLLPKDWNKKSIKTIELKDMTIKEQITDYRTAD